MVRITLLVIIIWFALWIIWLLSGKESRGTLYFTSKIYPDNPNFIIRIQGRYIFPKDFHLIGENGQSHNISLFIKAHNYNQITIYQGGMIRFLFFGIGASKLTLRRGEIRELWFFEIEFQ